LQNYLINNFTYQISISIFAPIRQLRGCRIICGAAGSFAGLQEHGGVRGEVRFPPKKVIFFIIKPR